MVILVSSPEWFTGFDLLLEGFFIIVTFLIAFYSYKFYKLNGNIKYKYFGLAFLLMSLSFIGKGALNALSYFGLLDDPIIKVSRLLLDTSESAQLLLVSGFVAHRFLMLLAFMGIFLVLYDLVDRKQVFLNVYFLAIIVLLSKYNYYVFHITSALLLMFIVYYYYTMHAKKKKKGTLLVLFAFLTLFISQLLFLLLTFDTIYYVAAEIVQLIGFMALLANAYMIFWRK